MSITKRQEIILELLREQGFLTVTKLSELTYTSESSIRRDLTQLQNMYLVKRTHGGVRVLNEMDEAVNLNNRMSQNTIGKRKIAQKAASLLCDGQSILLDGSSTTSFLIPHIAKHRDVILFTNNMLTCINAINYGINAHCIGGSSVNHSAVLAGEAAYKAVSEIYADMVFVSSYGLDENGVISDPTLEENYLRQLMLQHGRKRVFLCDGEKFNRKALYTLASVNDMDYAVFDVPWEALQVKCRLLA